MKIFLKKLKIFLTCLNSFADLFSCLMININIFFCQVSPGQCRQLLLQGALDQISLRTHRDQQAHSVRGQDDQALRGGADHSHLHEVQTEQN